MRCILHYFEHVLIVIHQVADENPVNSVENASVLEPNTLSLGWAVQNS